MINAFRAKFSSFLLLGPIIGLLAWIYISNDFCHSDQSREVASISFPENHRPDLRIGVISPEIPEADDHDMAEDPDSLPPRSP